ncbi:MAG TPA: amino acid adenylation domain-containing protein, partial [Symbiobacteriaceae bacterium]|nr:amino acid adenylation domain-containing protein [Symbiobacteriaceae bacterium]
DDFFDLGGHSLMATRVVARVRDCFGQDVPVRVLFEHRTLAEFVAAISAGGAPAGRPPVRPVPRTNNAAVGEPFSCAASYSQERLWFLCAFDSDASPAYNILRAVRVAGDLNVPAMVQAMNAVVARHEVLRTSFAAENGVVRQVIWPACTLPVSVTDFLAVPEQDRDEAVRGLAEREARLAFDLNRAPLVRVTLVQTGEAEHMLLVTLHHTIADAWSVSIFVQEVAERYAALVTGKPDSLPSLPVQYADFAIWQRNWLQGDELQRQVDYWRDRLDRVPALELPADRPRPRVQTFNGATVVRTLPGPLVEALSELSRREGATLFMTLMAGWQTLLARYSGQDDFAVGSPIANRTRPELEGLIGCFINTLALRADLSGNPTFAELIGRVREVCLEAYARQDVPFERLVEELRPERNLSWSPFFQVMFTLQNVPAAELSLSGLRLAPVEFSRGTAQFDLSLTVLQADGEWSVMLDYNTDLFDRTTAERMLTHLQTLLQRAAQDPEQHLSELPLLSAVERRQLLEEWGQGGVVEAPFPSVYQWIADQAERTPDAVAVVTPGDDLLTYRELNRQANQLAHYLRQLGIQPETRVGICLERSPQLVVAALAVWKAGGAYVPLDPAYPPERIAFMLEDSAAPVLLTSERLKGELPSYPGMAVGLDREQAAIAAQPDTNPAPLAEPRHLAYILYTSGSTGRPKGVMITHASLVSTAAAYQKAYGLGETSCHIQMYSFSFDGATGDLVRALCAGARLLICPREILLSPDRLYALMCRGKVDAGEFIPAVMRNLLQYLEETGQRLDFMKVMIVSSDVWYIDEYRRLQALCGPQTRLINAFGVTEAAIDSTYLMGGVADQDLPTQGIVPIGVPLPNHEIYILDRYLQPVPVGVIGELHIGGRGVARGYLNRPQLTAERFVPHPFARGDGLTLYKTGDLARYLPDGRIDFLGRQDNQVKIRGFRIELGEIEAVLGQHPQVGQAVVVVQEAGPNDRWLVAYMVPGGPEPPDVESVRSFLRERLPEYMVPAAFVLMDALPLTPVGKVDRRALPVNDWKQRPESGYVAPRNALEQQVAAVWAEVLGLSRVSVDDDFFALGGHSLLATQVVARLSAALGLTVPIRLVFERPTPAALAEALSELTAPAPAPETGIPPVPRVAGQAETAYEGSYLVPASFGQQRLWFLCQLEPEVNIAYNMLASVRIDGQLDRVLLQQAVDAMMARHEVLRAGFTVVEGELRQVIAPALAVTMPLIDLGGMPETERDAELKRLAAAEAGKPFDITCSPLMHVTLVRLTAERHVLLVSLHHTVSDAWSEGVFVRELVEYYCAFAENRPARLAPLPIQ